MKREVRIVDNRVFLLALDEMYRAAMKRHEADELLQCAREVANALAVPPADVPIEGYYTESESLTEYFRLMRALQHTSIARARALDGVPAYTRLRQVTESPIFGLPNRGLSLISSGKDALTVALEATFPQWSVENLTRAAYECAAASSDYSLVALAALSRDPVVLAALRESVVLYAIAAGGAAPQQPEYLWQVDKVIEERAVQFIETFNRLFSENLPRPARENAGEFWLSFHEWKIAGRCVRIGFDPRFPPVRHYHWAIDIDDQHRPIVREFWDTEIWTTARYRATSKTNDAL